MKVKKYTLISPFLHYEKLTYHVSLYSTGVCTVDYVDECERHRKVRFYYVIRDGGFTNTRTVDYNDSLLKTGGRRGECQIYEIKSTTS